MVNQLKEKPKEKAPKKEKKEKQNPISRSVGDVIKGDFLTKDSMVQSLPFFLFLAFLTLCYIGNGYYAEDTVRELNKVSGELKELRSEYISTKSELMFRSKQSEVAKALEVTGVKESVTPPKKIVLAKNK